MNMELDFNELKLEYRLLRLVYQIAIAVFYIYKTFFLLQLRLKTNEINLIFSTILPMIKDENIIKLFDLNTLIMAFDFVLSTKNITILVEGGDIIAKNLYDLEIFKFVDKLFIYEIIYVNKIVHSFYKKILKHNNSIFFDGIKKVSLFTLYLLQNKYIDKNLLLENIITISKEIQATDSDRANIVENLFSEIFKYYEKTPLSLLNYSKLAVRKNIKGLSDKSLLQLNLPKHLDNFLIGKSIK